MKTDSTYNGWANYSTWNVHLWMTDSEAIYSNLARRPKPWTPIAAKAYFRTWFPQGTPDMRGRIPVCINWREIADAFNECRPVS